VTCVVAVSRRTSALLAADTQGTTPTTYQRADRADTKVFNLAPWLAIGGSGSYRAIQIVRYHIDARDWSLPAEHDRHGWAVTTLVPALRTALRDNGALRVENGVEQGDTYLVAVGRSIFIVYSDWQVAAPRTPYAAIGAGDDIAVGYLAAGIEAGKRLTISAATRAVRAAAIHNASVGRNVTIAEAEESTDA